MIEIAIVFFSALGGVCVGVFIGMWLMHLLWNR